MKKTIIALAALAVLAVGAYLYFNKGQAPDKNPVPVTNENTIPNAIGNFYRTYENCVKNPPGEAEGRVSEYCQNNSGQTSAAFAANLEKGGVAKAGADPVFCAQNVPEGMKVDSDFQVKNNKATGFMLERFGSAQTKVQIDLVYESGSWKIDNVVCPKS